MVPVLDQYVPCMGPMNANVMTIQMRCATSVVTTALLVYIKLVELNIFLSSDVFSTLKGNYFSEDSFAVNV